MFTADTATNLGGLPVVSTRTVPDGQWLVAGGTVFVGEYDEAGHEVISAELVACTLGARVRPELQVAPRARGGWVSDAVDAMVCSLHALGGLLGKGQAPA